MLAGMLQNEMFYPEYILQVQVISWWTIPVQNCAAARMRSVQPNWQFMSFFTDLFKKDVQEDCAVITRTSVVNISIHPVMSSQDIYSSCECLGRMICET